MKKHARINQLSAESALAAEHPPIAGWVYQKLLIWALRDLLDRTSRRIDDPKVVGRTGDDYRVDLIYELGCTEAHPEARALCAELNRRMEGIQPERSIHRFAAWEVVDLLVDRFKNRLF